MPALFSSKDLEKFREFLNVEGKKLLIYHRDADGITSTSLFLKIFPGFETIPRKGPNMDESFLKQIEKKDPFLIVILDIPVDQEYKAMRKLAEKLPSCRFIIIDHHIIENDMNSNNIIHINPRFKLKNSYIPVSYVLYRMLCSMGFNMKKYVWISAIGVVGDHAFDECKELLNECEKIYPGSVGDIQKSRIKMESDLISAAIASKGYKGASHVLDVLTHAEDMKDLENDEEIKRWKVGVDSELKRIMKSFEKKKKEYKDIRLIEYEINTKYSLASAISGQLSEKNPEKILFIYKKSEGGWKISMRYQNGDINLGDLVKSCLGPNDSGGGHEKAAGGFIADMDKFIKCLHKKLKAISF